MSENIIFKPYRHATLAASCADLCATCNFFESNLYSPVFSSVKKRSAEQTTVLSP